MPSTLGEVALSAAMFAWGLVLAKLIVWLSVPGER